MKNLQKLFASVLLFSLAVSATNANAVAAPASAEGTAVAAPTGHTPEALAAKTKVDNLEKLIKLIEEQEKLMQQQEELTTLKNDLNELKDSIDQFPTLKWKNAADTKKAAETLLDEQKKEKTRLDDEIAKLEAAQQDTATKKGELATVEKKIKLLNQLLKTAPDWKIYLEKIVWDTNDIDTQKVTNVVAEVTTAKNDKIKEVAEKNKEVEAAKNEVEAANRTKNLSELKIELEKARNDYYSKLWKSPTTDQLKLKDDCRVNGTCTTETKKEEIKKEEAKEIIKEIVEEAKKEIAEQPTVVIVEKELNGKKYSYTSKPAHRTIVEKLLKEDISNFNSKFVDISSSNSENDIKRLERAGVVVWTTPTTFEPSKAITRAEFLAIVLGAYGYDIYAPAKNLPFTDVNANSWQARVVSAALENGFVSNENSMFRPNEQISKIEALAILYSISGFKADATTTSFMDAAADWQTAVLAQTEYLELVNVPADKKFYPNAGISRADMASTVVNFAKLY